MKTLLHRRRFLALPAGLGALRLPGAAGAAGALAAAAAPAVALAGDPVEALHDFVREARTGRGSFTQTVTPPGGGRRRVSSGSFEFLRPDHFRFSYARPFEQLIVSDGARLWLHDPELNQVTVRRVADALGSTPMAILSGRAPDRDFELAAEKPADGLDWVLATPRRQDGTIRSVRIGFRGRDLAAIEIADSFGQRSLLEFRDLKVNVPLTPERFRFTPPPGADVIAQ
jgi:outer membrane lipoprotein carrier protein